MAAVAWDGPRHVSSGHRLRRRTGTVVNYVEDAYLRDDIPSGIPGVEVEGPKGARRSTHLHDGLGTASSLGAAARCYLVPDAAALTVRIERRGRSDDGRRECVIGNPLLRLLLLLLS